MSNDNTDNENIENLEENEELNTQDEETQEVNLEDELATCQEALKEKENEYLRAYADLENTKKRLEKDKQTALIYANETFAKDLLTVLDTFENALKSIEQVDNSDEDAVEKIKEGMNLTYDQLHTILNKHGVEEVSVDGEFDPNIHQAVMHVDSQEHESGEIVDILQKGYKLKDRLLRPAMTSISK